jgi:hypothetical protein
MALDMTVSTGSQRAGCRNILQKERNKSNELVTRTSTDTGRSTNELSLVHHLMRIALQSRPQKTGHICKCPLCRDSVSAYIFHYNSFVKTELEPESSVCQGRWLEPRGNCCRGTGSECRDVLWRRMAILSSDGNFMYAWFSKMPEIFSLWPTVLRITSALPLSLIPMTNGNNSSTMDSSSQG